ncbi:MULTISPECIES: AAA family ATPase [Mesorhizobium]|nr:MULTISPECIES: ATP-binding protein [Mesorhizobium]MBE1710611.1 ATP-binding protein [Mesorhizobium japonicum]MBE1712509.1 ATP-binding protein [Mesorhizobium japonicum]MUT24678.1 AAA family ATPase [Mesorhizobium japonicum]MUT29340.1 AAA family ATPase [Mesorhizobium japonicum]PBB15103.1 ATP-binding protein [Mesorhizobium loti]
MLLRFEAGNFLSLRDTAELSLVASSLKDDAVPLFEPSAAPGTRVVSSALIYGPNASGKSNIVSAISYMRSFVLYSHNRGSPEGKINRRPFALDSSYSDRPTSFEVDFISGGTRYTYGFELSNEHVVAEWLFSYPNNRRQLLFERDLQEFSFGRNLRGRNQTIADLTRQNSLFISAAAQNDHSELTSVYRFFDDIVINSSIDVNSTVASRPWKENSEIDNRIINFLSNVGTGVIGYRRREREKTKESVEFQKNFNQLLRTTFGEVVDKISLSDDSIEKDVTLQLAHMASGGKQVFFNLDKESAGTRRLLALLAPIFAALDHGGLIVIDEIDASLHTRACEAILALFSSTEFNANGAQLIATTHDTNILSSNLLRRDQIWFCEKGDTGETALFPLTDLRTRATDNIEKGYLQGRFGAIPFAGSPSQLLKTLRDA